MGIAASWRGKLPGGVEASGAYGCRNRDPCSRCWVRSRCAGRHPIRFRVRLLNVGLSIATKRHPVEMRGDGVVGEFHDASPGLMVRKETGRQTSAAHSWTQLWL